MFVPTHKQPLVDCEKDPPEIYGWAYSMVTKILPVTELRDEPFYSMVEEDGSVFECGEWDFVHDFQMESITITCPYCQREIQQAERVCCEKCGWIAEAINKGVADKLAGIKSYIPINSEHRLTEDWETISIFKTGGDVIYLQIKAGTP